MPPIYQKQPYQTRWASFENPTGSKGQGGRENQGAKGHAFDAIAPGEAKTLLDVQGNGLIHRLWLTLRQRSPAELRALQLDMFWDGVGKSAVSVPLGDFFCCGLGVAPFENELFASPEGRSFICTIPMPFRTAAKITLTNESNQEIPHLFYDINYSLYHRRGRREKKKTAVSSVYNLYDEDMLYFHAHWRRENPTQLSQDFEILPRVLGNGRFLGASFSVITHPVYGSSWWGEGEVKLYLDGDEEYPTLVGTGAEDYIGTGWGQGTFAQRYQGSLIVDKEKGFYSFYRLHLPDPVFFQQDCHITIQQMGGALKQDIPPLLAKGAKLQVISADGGGYRHFRKLLDMEGEVEDTAVSDNAWCNFYRQDDWAATAYFYLNTPQSDLPLLAPVLERVAGL